jgi:signal transduction histidine kinase
MLTTRAIVPEERHLVLSSLSPSRAQKRLALALSAGILIVFALITVGPLKAVRPNRMDAFVPVYATAMFVCDAITAALLYAQFAIARSRATLVIASGYLFVALMLIPWILVFPGFLSPTGLMGGMQSTSWIYFLQHAGFPLFVIGYAFSRNAAAQERPDRAGWAIALSVALTAALVLAASIVCVAGATLLPAVVLDSVHLSPSWPYFGAPVALLSVVALVVLWCRRRTILDLWLMVVMLLFSIEIPLSYYPAPERFAIGWYTVRLFGMLSSSIVLTVLLYEITALYARLLGAVLGQRREREARLVTGDVVAATVAHEVRQPLTAMITSADAGLRFLDRSNPNVDRAKEAFRRIASDGHRAGAVVENIRANFRNDVRTTTLFDANELVQDVLALESENLQRHRILVRSEWGKFLPYIRGNRIQMHQVLLNLVTNAVEAMAAKDAPRVLRVKSEAAGDRVMISVADTGSGISAENADRIFNPLFTTKSEGMGMGLAICRSIIEAHNGRLWFTPNSPCGAVFQFTLQVEQAETRQHVTL